MHNQSVNNTKCYVLDTNILINFSLWRPISMSVDFWNKLSSTLANKKWILLDVVVSEVKFDSDLINWCKNQKQKGLVTILDDDSKDRAVEINNIYTMINPATSESTVDTFIIAFAERNHLGVFSRESEKDPLNPKALYKIPDVCKKLKVENIRRPATFFKNIGF